MMATSMIALSLAIVPSISQTDIVRPDYDAVIGISRADAQSFYDMLESATASDDAQAIASLIRYPLLVIGAGGQKYNVTNRAAFLRRYRSIFTTSVKRAIRCQDFDTLLVSSRGIGFANGTVWSDASVDHTRVEIITINQRAAASFTCKPNRGVR